MNTPLKTISVYAYLDYRAYLADVIAEKRAHKKFSFRSFNARAGFKSPSFLRMVMAGKRNLSEDGITAVARGLVLDKDETHHFRRLVHFAQAKTEAEKEQHYRRLCQLKKFAEAKPLTVAQHEIFSNWYAVAILELLRARTTHPKNRNWLARCLRPTVSIGLIEQTLAHLQTLRLIRSTEKGDYERTEESEILIVPDALPSHTIANFHVHMGKMALEAITRDSAENIDFSSLTVLTSQRGIALLKQECADFRRRLHLALESHLQHEPADRVVHINLQAFLVGKVR